MTDDVLRRFQFHTPISAVMELVNELGGAVDAPDARFAAETAVSVIQPYAPHVAEELWGVLGRERLWEQAWPEPDETQLVRDTFELVVQVNGKVRDRFEVDAALSEDELVARARESERVRSYLDGGEPRKTIVVARQARQLRRLARAFARIRPVDVPVAADGGEPAHAALVLVRAEHEAADHALTALEVAVEDVDAHALRRLDCARGPSGSSRSAGHGRIPARSRRRPARRRGRG